MAINIPDIYASSKSLSYPLYIYIILDLFNIITIHNQWRPRVTKTEVLRLKCLLSVFDKMFLFF